MVNIENQNFDQERALYNRDGESALKESRNISVNNCFFNLRYPFWHDDNLSINNSEMTDKCRASLWYSKNISINNTRMHGIKALRECENVSIHECDIVSPEFGWSVKNITMCDSKAVSEYFMMRSENLSFSKVELKGKYSFQYITESFFDNCNFDTKDSFWHAKDVVIRNSTIKGEYLAWYCENVTFENCTIIGTQPLCYCKNLKLINCKMIESDLAFEKSEVEATLVSEVVSIKNPKSGKIVVPKVGEIIRDDPNSQGEIEIIGS